MRHKSIIPLLLAIETKSRGVYDVYYVILTNIKKIANTNTKDKSIAIVITISLKILLRYVLYLCFDKKDIILIFL